MFHCGVCQKSSQLGEDAFRIVKEWKAILYPKRWHPPSVEHPEGNEDPGGKGWGVAQELLAHKACAEKWLLEHPLPISMSKKTRYRREQPNRRDRSKKETGENATWQALKQPQK